MSSSTTLATSRPADDGAGAADRVDVGGAPLTVAHVVTPAVFGGLESALLLLATGQAAAGLDVHVIPTLIRPEASAPWVARLREAGVQVTPIVGSARDYVGETRRLVALCRELRPDVVHTHGHRSDILGWIAARLTGTPVVTTLHGFVGGDLKMRVYEWIQRRAVHRFDAVVAVSGSMAGTLRARGLRPERLHVVANAFRTVDPPLSRDEARRALGIPDDRFTLGWVGRLSHEKGVDVAIRALAEAGAGDAALSVVGDGAEREPARALADSLGVAPRVTWHGSMPGAGRYLRAFDALVLSSRTEGTPIVVFEAMAAEVPIVATRVGGVPDMLGGGEALLVPSEAPGELAAAIAAVRADRASAQTRASAARARLDRDYALGPWVERYSSIYRSIARRTTGAASRS